MKHRKTYKIKNNNECHVYKLVNSKGEIEYIGETYDIKIRFTMHLTSSKSKFLGRKDLQIIVIKTFDNKKDAFHYQCSLQKELGFETDIEKSSKSKIAIKCYDISGNYVNNFNSIKEASRILSINAGNVCRVLKGIVKQTSGYTFEYDINH
jgi:predicted GIY-YIG superfamily endonuclease